MGSLRERNKTVNITETVFNILYLTTIAICAVLLFMSKEQFKLIAAFCAALLFVGDAFHLVPRIAAMHSSKKDFTAAMGMGKLITSIGMTLFYLGLIFVAKAFYGFENIGALNLVIIFGIILAACRTILCLMPQNKWKEGGNSFGIYRNIPFVLLGLLAAALYFYGAIKFGGDMSAVWILILLSFAFYLPVVLYGAKRPKLGMLMLPKSIAYAAIVIIFTVI